MKKAAVFMAMFAVAMLFNLIAQANENPFKVGDQQVFWAKALRTDFYGFDPRKDVLAGMTYAGATFAPTMIGDEGRVFFPYEGKSFFFRGNDVVTDPRQTERWQFSLDYCKASTLWSRVQEGAGIQGFPAALTWAIIEDMVFERVTTWEEINSQKMTPERLDQMMKAYTNIIED